MNVSCDRGIAKEISEYFTFEVPGHKYMASYRSKFWDGTIKLYNMYDQSLYRGLMDYLTQFAVDRKYTIKIPDTPSEKHSKESVEKYMAEYIQPHAMGKDIKAFPHQVDAIMQALNKKRCLLLSPTGSGKSLIIYSLMRYYIDKIPKDKKILLVVPTVALVSQMRSDFIDYSKKNKWKVDSNCHCLYAGQGKETDKKVTISTWQSIYKMPDKFFKDFYVIFGDECHLFKSKSLTSIMTKLRDCPYRVGTTGTLDDVQINKLVIQGLFGSVYKVTTTTELIEQNMLSNLKINCILLEYSDAEKKEVRRAKYQEEMDWLVKNDKRNNFITDLSLTLKGNTLVLFQFVEKHGKILYTNIESKTKNNRKVFFVYGGTDVDVREEIRHIVEKEDNAIIIASYGTFSTGISIRNLHNIIFASPSKSRIRILQSIGRQLRKSEQKVMANLYDIGDNLAWKSWKNHTFRHFAERLKIYNSEKFEYKTDRIKL
jgi:superfamily II DNA or RNA helicase